MCSAKSHADLGQHLWVLFTSTIRMKKTCDLNDFDCGMIVGATWFDAKLQSRAEMDNISHEGPVCVQVFWDDLSISNIKKTKNFIIG